MYEKYLTTWTSQFIGYRCVLLSCRIAGSIREDHTYVLLWVIDSNTNTNTNTAWFSLHIPLCLLDTPEMGTDKVEMNLPGLYILLLFLFQCKRSSDCAIVNSLLWWLLTRGFNCIWSACIPNSFVLLINQCEGFTCFILFFKFIYWRGLHMLLALLINRSFYNGSESY